MKLYKFRSIDRLEWLADILIHERLYCPQYYELNDPFEGACTVHGTFEGGRRYYAPTTVEDLRDPEETVDYRLCSLSATISDIKLWSHYAGGHRGVALEIDFTGHEDIPRPINYTVGLRRYDETKGEHPSLSELLLQKTKDWEYENEFRILKTKPYLDIKNRIKRVILGVRCKKDDETIILRLKPQGTLVVRSEIDELSARVKVRSNEVY
jgi:hypothetical protein